MQFGLNFLGSCERSELPGLNRPDGEPATRSDAEGGRSSAFSSSREKSERIRSPWSGFREGGRYLGIPQFPPAECLTPHGSRRLVLEGVALVVHRRAIAERGMAAMRIVPTLQPIKDRHLRFRLGFAASVVQYFALQGREETLRHGVVVRITDRAHRGHDTGFATAL